MTAPGDDGFKMAGAYVELTVKDDTQSGVDEAKANIEATDPAKLSVKADLDERSVEDVGAKLKTESEVLGEEAKVNLKVGVDETSLADAEARIKAAADASGGAAGGGAGLGMAGAIAGAVAIGSGALAGGALAAIPVLLTAIGVEAEKSSPQVQQAFSSMEAAAKQALQTGFSPFIPAFVEIADQAKSTVTGLEPDFLKASAAADPLLKTMSTGLLTAVKEGVQGTAQEVGSLGPVATAIGDDFVKVEQGVGGFFKALDVGSAAQGVTILGTDIQEALPVVGQLLNTVAPLGNALLGVLGPALRDIGNELSVLRPLFEATGAVVQYLGPEIGLLVGPLALASGAAKLLTGSWTDFGGAATKLLSPLKDTGGTLNSLASVVGITTKASKEATVQTLTEAAARAKMQAAADAEAASVAVAATASDDSAKAALAAAVANDTAAASAKGAATAEADLAAASEAANFSMGPLGIAIGVIGFALAPLALDAGKTSQSTDQLTGSLQKLEQAAADQKSLANLFQTDPNAEAQLTLLQKYGVTLEDLAHAADGDVAAQQKIAAASQQAVDASNQQVTAAKKAADATSTNNVVLGESGQTYTSNAADVQTSTDALNAATAQQTLANQTQKDAKSALDATNAAQTANAQTTKTAAEAMADNLKTENDYANAFNNLVSQINQGTSGIKAFEDAQVAAAGANASAVANFAQLGQAVTSTEQAYQSAAHGIVTAEQGVQSALQGVSTAQYGAQQAEQSYQNALQQETQVQRAITTARQQAQQALVNLQLTANDAAAGTLNAGVNLFDATTSAAALGVTTANAHQIAGQTVTATNEAQIKAAIALISAQNQVADATNSSAQAQVNLNTAQAQGIDGNPAVVSANQQLVSSAQQVANAQHGVETAQLAVQTASIALQNAQYAVSQAQQAARDAAIAHTQAVEADSHSTDISTVSGNSNWTMLENLYQKNLAATGSVQEATSWTEQEGEKMGFTSGQIDNVVNSITRIPSTTNFSIVGTPALNLATLIQQAQAEGINVDSLGLSASQLGLAQALTQPVRGGSYAEGGLFRGAGTPTSDSNVIAVSDQEYIVNAASTAKHLPLIEAINNDEVPGYANGGPITAKQAMAMNYHLAGWDAMLQSASYILQGGLGVNTPNLPTANAGTVDFGTFANAGSSNAGGQIAYNGPSGVAQWASVIDEALGMLGQPTSWLGTVERRMNQESGGNPTVVNKWDSNWSRGTPSVGLMQVIGPTFRSWAGPFGNTGPFEYGVSVDPLANTYAGLNYAMHRYGSLSALNRPGGYDSGGYALPGITPVVNGTGRPEMLLPPSMSDTLERIDSSVQTGAGNGSSVTNHYWNVAPVVKTDSPTELATKVAASVQWSLMTTVGG